MLKPTNVEYLGKKEVELVKGSTTAKMPCRKNGQNTTGLLLFTNDTDM
jgi:hypothetical protein